VLISSEFILGEIWTHLWIIELVKMNDFFWYLDGFPISTQFHDGFFFLIFLRHGLPILTPTRFLWP